MKKEPVQRRFFRKVEFKASCWNWTGTFNNGTVQRGFYYGQFWDKKIWSAHRWSYTFFRGEIPEGKMVCHHCDNPSCVNPFHLFVGTAKDNMQDCLRKGRHPLKNKTRCPQGHLYAGDNLIIDKKSGGRKCRICQRKSWRASSQKLRDHKKLTNSPQERT